MKKITRRAFFKKAASLAAVIAVAPKALLEIRRAEKTVCIGTVSRVRFPSRKGNQLMTPDMVTKEALRIAHEKLAFIHG